MRLSFFSYAEAFRADKARGEYNEGLLAKWLSAFGYEQGIKQIGLNDARIPS